MSNDNLSHISWKCKYHIVFAPKYRRQVVYHQLKSDIGQILYSNLFAVHLVSAGAGSPRSAR